MSDIFISYSREDSKFVEALIIALIDYGWSVWSDKSGISEGRPYDEQTENAILEATVALVIWSQSSVKSRWVRAEAAYALSRNKLIPIIADGSDPPLQFLHIQGVNLVDWRRTNDDAAFKKLASVLSQRLDRVGRIPQSDNETNLPARTAASSLSGAFSFWKSLRDAAFPPVSAGFEQYYTNRTFFIAQFTCVFGFFLVTLFGLLDFFCTIRRSRSDPFPPHSDRAIPPNFAGAKFHGAGKTTFPNFFDDFWVCLDVAGLQDNENGGRRIPGNYRCTHDDLPDYDGSGDGPSVTNGKCGRAGTFRFPCS